MILAPLPWKVYDPSILTVLFYRIEKLSLASPVLPAAEVVMTVQWVADEVVLAADTEVVWVVVVVVAAAVAAKSTYQTFVTTLLLLLNLCEGLYVDF